jgi:hypothetical protein
VLRRTPDAWRTVPPPAEADAPALSRAGGMAVRTQPQGGLQGNRARRVAGLTSLLTQAVWQWNGRWKGYAA